ncbi:MAG: hypothetical protein R2839_05635 [Thermomicrobiales bacterium]
MYEIFPIVAGAIIALLIPRFFHGRDLRWALGIAGVGTAALATFLAGEEWFFIVIDLALVFLAIGATLYVVSYVRERNRLRLP